jgi:hypothetical protein
MSIEVNDVNSRRWFHALGVLGCCLFIAALVALAGCRQDERLGQVHGTITLDGQPLTTGTVRFTPEAGRAASGKIGSDGSYMLGTFGERDGALLGRHKVAIIAYEAGGDGRPAYEVRKATSKPLVPQRYMAPGTSGLSFEVKPGSNQADFELTSK